MASDPGGGARDLERLQNRPDLERFAISHHPALNQALGDGLKRPPADSTFR